MIFQSIKIQIFVALKFAQNQRCFFQEAIARPREVPQRRDNVWRKGETLMLSGVIAIMVRPLGLFKHCQKILFFLFVFCYFLSPSFLIP